MPDFKPLQSLDQQNFKFFEVTCDNARYEIDGLEKFRLFVPVNG